MTETFSPPLAPAPSSNKEYEYKILQASFGDGQGQMAADGLNNVRVVYNLVWKNITESQADAIEAFMTARGGFEKFNYTFPGDSARLFRNGPPSRSWSESGVLCDVSVTIREVF